MMTSNNEQYSLIRLFQFQAALQKNLDFAYLKKIVDQESNINCQIPDSDYVRNQKPELIGSTLLHLVRRKEKNNSDIFKYLILDRGVDFTIKNGNGSTALLQPIEINENELLETSDLPTLMDKLDSGATVLILSEHVKQKIVKNPCNNYGISHFHVACMLRDTAAVKFFLQNGVSANLAVSITSPILPGYSPLHFAIESDSPKIIDILLDYGANINCKDARGKTPLHILIERRVDIKLRKDEMQRELKIIEEKMCRLLRNHTTSIIDDTGLSHLHVACILPSTPMLEEFAARVKNVDHAIKMDSPFFPGYTALHFAMLLESGLARSLLEKGANIFAEDANGVTPLDICLESNEIRRIHWRLSSKPGWKGIFLSDGRTRLFDLIIAMQDEVTFISFLRHQRFNVNTYVPEDSPLFPKCSTLHLAVRFANLGIIRICLNDNPNLFAQDSHGSTPLHLAFRCHKIHAVNLLLDYHRNILINAVDNDKLSVLHIAAAANDTDLVYKLLQFALEDINSPTGSKFNNDRNSFVGEKDDAFFINPGSTLLHTAVANKNRAMILFLVEKGADIHAPDASGLTPIHRALISDIDEDVVNIFLSDPNLKDRVVRGVNLSYLHVACFANNVSAVRRLLDLGSDMMEAAIKCPSEAFSFLADLEGFTPIHIAMQEENLEVLKLLLQQGADILARKPDGSTPLYLNLINKPRFFLKLCLEELCTNDKLLRRIEDDIGLTILHLACYGLRQDLVLHSLRRRINVNSRVRSKSPIWPECTPLHALMYRINGTVDGHNDETISACKIMTLLLHDGADVSMLDIEGESPLHLADEMLLNSGTQSDDAFQTPLFTMALITAMLLSTKDFTENPKNRRGISLFDIACRICHVETIKKFLEKGCNVNQQIDFFGDGLTAGYTPLHLSMSYFLANERKVEAVELLLNYGADCHAKSILGDTPLHTAARFNDGPLRLCLLRRLMNEKADANARNLLGETPFEIVLKSKCIATEEITLFLNSGCRANTYNSMTQLGYLPLSFDKICYDTQDQVLDVLINSCNIHETDHQGRTAIHNVVSTKRPTLSKRQYITLIQKLIETGCELDGQDNLGRTALHLAVQLDNHQAVRGLLVAGADINILDKGGKSAASYSKIDLMSTLRFQRSSDILALSREPTFAIVNSLAFHIYKLRCFNLDVIEQNIKFQGKACEEILDDGDRTLQFSKEITETKSVKIGYTSISLHSFLSEDTIVAYPTMPLSQREEIDKFFEAKAEFLRNQFLESESLLRLQHRKAVKRWEVMHSAKCSLQNLFMKIKGLDAKTDYVEYNLNESHFLKAKCPGTILPELCCENILRYLTNKEIDNLIVSTEKSKI